VSIREIVGRLIDAKTHVIQAKAIGDQTVARISEATHLVDRVLDDVQDKGLSGALTGKARDMASEFDGVMGLTRGIDTAIQRAQGIGR
jgi:hypothetical protein